MRQPLRLISVAGLVAAVVLGLFIVPGAAATSSEVLYDNGSFADDNPDDGVPDAFQPSTESEWAECEGNRDIIADSVENQSNDSVVKLKIWEERNDPGSCDTWGSPGYGDYSIYKSWDVSATGHYYRAWAKAKIQKINGDFGGGSASSCDPGTTSVPCGFRAKIKWAAWSSSEQIGECKAAVSETSSGYVTVSTPDSSQDSCAKIWPTPSTTKRITLAVRAHTEAEKFWGVALFDNIRFVRCARNDNGSVGNCPGPSW